MKNKNIIVLGASENPDRTSYSATILLKNRGYDVFALNLEKGTIGNVEIHDTCTQLESVDTVTIFLNPQKQKKYYQCILSLHPKQIIFNPGTENAELEELARSQKITIIKGCTIAFLMTGYLF